MSLRDRAHQHAEGARTTRKLSEPFDAPWPAEGDAQPDQLAVRELGAKARLALMAAMEFDTQTQLGRMDLSATLPFVTDLIVEHDSAKPVFEISDHDWLVETYPALVQKALMTAMMISDLGDSAAEAAEGNSEPTPN
jgi:hypothetical protein